MVNVGEYYTIHGGTSSSEARSGRMEKGKSRLVKYYSIWPDDIESLIVARDARSWSTGRFRGFACVPLKFLTQNSAHCLHCSPVATSWLK